MQQLLDQVTIVTPNLVTNLSDARACRCQAGCKYVLGAQCWVHLAINRHQEWQRQAQILFSLQMMQQSLYIENT